jgi:glutamate carboxypeptidase
MPGLNSSEAALIEPIEQGNLLAHTLAWSAINSGTGNLAGLAVIADLLAAAFATLPGAVALVDPEPTEMVDAAGKRIPVTAGQHLVLRVRPEASRRILLTGHMDTVFSADDPFQQCKWLDDRRLRGPGVLDMKAGLAVMLAGLTAFKASRPSLGYDVLINSDEETGSASSSALIAALAQGKLAALLYDPSLPGGAIARSRPGSGNYSIVITGRSAHAGRNPDDGRNAIVAAADLALRLAKAHRPRLSVNSAKIEGGSANNVVPSHAVLRFNLRPQGMDEMIEARDLVAGLAAAVASQHEVSIEVHGGIGRPAKPLTPATERLFALVAVAAADLGGALSWRDSGGVCGGNNIAACGVPVIDTMGADGDYIHSPDEYLETGSLVPKAQLTALVLKRL